MAMNVGGGGGLDSDINVTPSKPSVVIRLDDSRGNALWRDRDLCSLAQRSAATVIRSRTGHLKTVGSTLIETQQRQPPTISIVSA